MFTTRMYDIVYVYRQAWLEWSIRYAWHIVWLMTDGCYAHASAVLHCSHSLYGMPCFDICVSRYLWLP